MITYFHRNLNAGFSINKVSQTIISCIDDKQEYYMPKNGASFRDIITNIIYTFRHRNKHGINHVTGDVHYVILALIGCKSILTIHDTVSLDYRNVCLFKKKILEWLWFRIPLKFATKVVCISEQTKLCIEKYTNRTDIVVIHNAVDSSFKKHIKEPTDNPINILLIGTNPNKNIDRTLEALKSFNCHLTIIGKLSIAQEDFLKTNHFSYLVKSGLTDEEIIAEYIKSNIVSFISLFEGFGMIVIEANMVGRPVICSEIPVLKEVAGDAALFVNPTNIESIKKGFKLLFEDSSYRTQLVQKGFENVKRFDANIIRQKWILLYNTVSVQKWY